MEVFFYGLFMDESILTKNGVAPKNPRKGYLNDYTLKIGNRASLVPCEGEKAYGIVMRVEEDQLVKLYAEPSVADYIPEEVQVVVEGEDPVSAMCYNLPEEFLIGTNASYARSLHELAKSLGFPDSYLMKIESMMS